MCVRVIGKTKSFLPIFIFIAFSYLKRHYYSLCECFPLSPVYESPLYVFACVLVVVSFSSTHAPVIRSMYSFQTHFNFFVYIYCALFPFILFSLFLSSVFILHFELQQSNEN